MTVDLAAQYRALRAEIAPAVNRVLASGQYLLGEETRAFEAEFAAYVGVPHAVGVASGTDAVTLTLRAVGVRAGDEVVTVSHTAVATTAAIEQAGAKPVFVDIAPDTFTLDPAQLVVSSKTRAIVPVHLYGHPADMDSIMEIAGRHGLWVIEDCAQAHGARYRGKPVGGFGDAGAFSFYPTKNLGAAGDGGMVVTRRADVAERLRSLRQYGWDEGRVSQEKGYNSRLDELQAAILRVKLVHLDGWNERRRELAAAYTDRLAGSRLATPRNVGDVEHVYHLYVVRAPERDAFLAHLRGRGINAGVHYPVPVHLQPAYCDGSALPETERAAAEVLSLPLYPEMGDEEIERVCQTIESFYISPAPRPKSQRLPSI